MSFEPYCRLYFQANVELSELLSKCAELLNGSLNGRTVQNALLYLTAKENDDFDEGRFRLEKRFVFARYTAELEGLDLDVDEDKFVQVVCDLVSSLRDYGIQVAASCEFEDRVIEKTGWNWSESSPDHPDV
ncbi:MAG: hypothetical protein AAF546_03370 [Verrucomicrobiota bacterium]